MKGKLKRYRWNESKFHLNCLEHFICTYISDLRLTCFRSFLEEIEDTKKTFRNWLTFSSLPSLPAWIAIWLPPCVRDAYLYRLPEVSPSLFCVYFNNNICNTTYVLIWVLGYLLVILLTYRSHKTLAYYVLQGVSYCFELLWRPRRPSKNNF